MKTEIISFGFMIFFILLDILTGLFYAKISKTYQSSKMRLGFYHKVGNIAIVLLFYLVSIYMHYCLPNNNLIEMFKLTECSSVYVIINEIGSLKENIEKIKDLKF